MFECFIQPEEKGEKVTVTLLTVKCLSPKHEGGNLKRSRIEEADDGSWATGFDNTGIINHYSACLIKQAGKDFIQNTVKW